MNKFLYAPPLYRHHHRDGVVIAVLVDYRAFTCCLRSSWMTFLVEDLLAADWAGRTRRYGKLHGCQSLCQSTACLSPIPLGLPSLYIGT